VIAVIHPKVAFAVVGMFVTFGLAPPTGAVPPPTDSIETCAEASESAQKLRDAGKYLAARTNLLRCASEACPAVVKQDCLAELGRLEPTIPSVVFGATGLPSDRVARVVVRVEGLSGSYRIDGRPVMVDPGPTSVRFDLDGKAVDLKAVLKVGERNRALEASFAPLFPPAPPASSPADQGSKTSTPWLGYSLVGVGAVAFGSMAYFWVKGSGEADDLRSGCGATRSCDQADVDHAKRTLVIGDVLGGVGVVATAVGVYLLVDHEPSLPEGDVRVGAALHENGAGLFLNGRFE
jgi:hypothetical protein